MPTETENRKNKNLSRSERIASAVAGGALAGLGVVLALKTKKGLWPGIGLAAAGGPLIFRGASGRCAVKAAMKNSAPIRIERTVTIPGKSPEEVYEFWRKLENLPDVIEGVSSVKQDGTRSRWTVKGPAGAPISWDAEITSEHPGKVIEFSSVPGSIVPISGIVRFKRKQGGGTKVHLSLKVKTPGGSVGQAIANAFHFKPEETLDAGLQNFREALEAK